MKLLGNLVGFVLAVAFGLYFIGFFSSGGSSCSSGLAQVHAARHVKNRLNDPASFTLISQDVIPLSGGECHFRVHLDFTARNEFGGTVRNQVIVDIESDREGSRLLDIKMEAIE